MELNFFNVVWTAFWIIVVSILSQSLVLQKIKEGEKIGLRQKLIIAFVCVVFFTWFFIGIIPFFSIDNLY